ncbi:MAG: uroporphyrinogen-III C-methyltransferase [Actinomycetia bacterium]|nr:uroporphyrinogen-III C-methyltransferase [Actinomycetes bacterium]
MGKNVKVYLVGAGPGDPELLTIRGQQCLQAADVVIYDYLANTSLLTHVPASAQKIFVGKKGFSEHVTQAEINDLLIAKALDPEINTVVRLKGGDPFVFGRGGEEALVLAQRGIRFEIVPGITAGIAAPAYAGIPITHRGLASSVAFITGHEDPRKDESAIDWQHLAKAVDTLCFYMGIQALPQITRRLIEAGRDPDTPVALVRWGSLPDQEVLVSTLDEAVEAVRNSDFRAPAIIVVGDVVRLRNQLTWFKPPSVYPSDNQPLLGKRVVVTRSRTQASALCELLTARGATVFEFPTIEIRPPASYEQLDAALQNLAFYQWLVFTSVNGVQFFMNRLLTSGQDARALAAARIATIGPATAEALRNYGIIANVLPDEYRAEGVLNALSKAGIQAGDHVLIPRASQARSVLPDILRQRGVQVEVVTAYQTQPPSSVRCQELLDQLRAKTIDVITFTSSSTVTNFLGVWSKNLKSPKAASDETKAANSDTPSAINLAGLKDSQTLLAGVQIASIGPVTSQTARLAGLGVSIEAASYTIPGLVEAIEKYYQGSKR